MLMRMVRAFTMRSLPLLSLKRKTSAALVTLPNHERNPREVSQGPIESARQGIGRWQLVAIFIASDLASTQLFTKNEQAVRGQITEKRDK